MINHAIGRISKIQNYDATLLEYSFKNERVKKDTGTIEKP
jgi:hypothetical protein